MCSAMNLTILLPWRHTGFQTSPIIKAFLAGHLWRFILIFANGASYAWSSNHKTMFAQWKYIKCVRFMFAQVCSLIAYFASWKSLIYWNQVGGDWKRVSCYGNIIFLRCVSCRTLNLTTSFNGLCCKLTEITLFIYNTWYKIGLNLWRDQASHLHILHIFQT